MLEDDLKLLLDELPEGGLSAWREAVEALASQAADPLLWRLRELEAATDGVPAQLGGVRRGAVWAVDRISVTFEGWADGERVVVRTLRRGLEQDPVWRRRLERAATHFPPSAVLAPSVFVPDPWPHVRCTLGGPSLADFLPAEDQPETSLLARFLSGGLAGLRALHDQGLVHGGLTPQHLVLNEGGVKLAWLDPQLEGVGAPSEDLAALGSAVAQLDPERRDPVGDLARGFAEDPPPNAELAEGLLLRTLAATLAGRRHSLALRGRMLSRAGDEARLLRAVRRLAESVPPPEGTYCLRQGHDAVMVVAESDGQRVRGGPVAGLPARFLPTVWSRDGGLEPTGARVLLRAWATRNRGDEDRRAEQAKELGHSDEQAQSLCRWLSAQSRLRAVRMLLELSG
jgi:hypothetical protein